MRQYRLASQPCPQGAQDGFAAQIGIAEKSAATEVRTGCRRGIDGVLDGAGNAGRQAAGTHARRTGRSVAPFRGLVIDEDTAELLVSMSAATIDRRLASEPWSRDL